jgi:hypothetical protein
LAGKLANRAAVSGYLHFGRAVHLHFKRAFATAVAARHRSSNTLLLRRHWHSDH